MYTTPGSPAQTEIVIKKSRFIARAALATDRAMAMAVLAAARADYPDAGHHCWAYILGAPGSAASAAMSDDGEPSGTAGKPILNVLQHKSVGDIVIVVSRYFGGIKLGAGGLVRAYSGAAQAVMEELRTVTHIDTTEVVVEVGFADEQPLRHWLGQHAGTLLVVEYQQVVRCRLSLPSTELDALTAVCEQRGWQRLNGE